MTRRMAVLGLAGLLLGVPALDASAQRGDRGGRPDRVQMERRLRQQLADLLRKQLNLDDEQMRQLSEVNQRFDQQRRELVRREMTTRRSLREEVMRGDSANPARIEQLMADQLRIERDRLDLTEQEQRDLSRFLTPVQRAKYLGVQEQMRRQMDQLRGRGMLPIGVPPDSGMRRGRRPPV